MRVIVYNPKLPPEAQELQMVVQVASYARLSVIEMAAQIGSILNSCSLCEERKIYLVLLAATIEDHWNDKSDDEINKSILSELNSARATYRGLVASSDASAEDLVGPTQGTA